MAINRDRLDTALSLIKRVFMKEKDQWWWHTTSTFDKFSIDIKQPLTYSTIDINDDLKGKYAKIRPHLANIKEDLRTLTTMLHQVD
jgi:hypothetical protein